MIQINLLPWRERHRQIKRAMFGVLLGAFFLLAIILIILVHIHISGQTSIQMERNAFLQTQINNAQADFTSLKEKKQEQIKLLSSLQFILNLRVRSYEAVQLLDVVAHATPTSMELEKIDRQNRTITISGTAETDNDVTVFMKNIASHAKFSQPVLTEISSLETATSSVRHFTIKIDEKG